MKDEYLTQDELDKLLCETEDVIVNIEESNPAHTLWGTDMWINTPQTNKGENEKESWFFITYKEGGKLKIYTDYTHKFLYDTKEDVLKEVNILLNTHKDVDMNSVYVFEVGYVNKFQPKYFLDECGEE